MHRAAQKKRKESWNYGGSNWKLSRSKIDLFLECPRCFYIDNKMGTKRPSIPSFQINKAVDYQLKREFDFYREKGERHPLQKENDIDAVPARHPKLDDWRENFKGVQHYHEQTGFLVSGAIDDLWVNSKGEHIVVDYKATAKSDPVTALDGRWHEGYKRQIEVYQWLLRHNDLVVSPLAYFVYCTGKMEQDSFDQRIEFDIRLIPYEGSDQWVEQVLFEIKKCLDASEPPPPGESCEYCSWWYARRHYEE